MGNFARFSCLLQLYAAFVSVPTESRKHVQEMERHVEQLRREKQDGLEESKGTDITSMPSCWKGSPQICWFWIHKG